MAVEELTLDKLDQTIKDNQVVMIDFWAPWCGPCRQFGPIFEKAAEEYADIAFRKVNTDEQGELAAKFEVRSIPTLAVFKDQNIVYKEAGALPAAALKELIGKLDELGSDQAAPGLGGNRLA